MYPYQIDQDSPPQLDSASQALHQPHFRDEQLMLMRQNPEPAPPYPADNTCFSNSNRSVSQEHQHGQTLVEQYSSQSLEGQYRVSSSGRQQHDSRTPDQTFRSGALEFTRQMSFITTQIRKLESPIAIPQTTPGLGKAFLRAWSPTLQYHNITVLQMIFFIDKLNTVSTANPPLQILDLAGGMVGMVPHHWAQLAGFAIQGTAKLGTVLVTKGRTEMYMQEANETMFKPRGLKVSLASTKAMRAVLKIPADRPNLAPLIAQTMNLSMLERVLMQVRPYNAALDLDVPPLAEQTTMLAKLSAQQVVAQEKKNQRNVLKNRENSRKKEEEQRQKDEQKSEKRRRKEEKSERKRDEKRWKGEGMVADDSGSSQLGETLPIRVDHDEKQSKEEKNAEKLLWIMIENL